MYPKKNRRLVAVAQHGAVSLVAQIAKFNHIAVKLPLAHQLRLERQIIFQEKWMNGLRVNSNWDCHHPKQKPQNPSFHSILLCSHFLRAVFRGVSRSMPFRALKVRLPGTARKRQSATPGKLSSLVVSQYRESSLLGASIVPVPGCLLCDISSFFSEFRLSHLFHFGRVS